ncbi:phosphotransferase [Microlunatus elymi]|uniref:phosphotransferase n=1 Tax=Microlunatus elymi TaxID=2596828 RepID=UPI00143DDE16|nr:phosphotransferase [Microlunatus elymi]
MDYLFVIGRSLRNRCAVLPEELAALAVSDANANGPQSWRLCNQLGGGHQSGAWRLESDRRQVAVLKLATPSWAQQMIRAERAVAKVRAAGYPTPAWLATGQTNGIGYQIQEFVQGTEVAVIGIAEAAELIKVLELQAGLDPDPDRCWSDYLANQLKAGLDALRADVALTGAPGRDLILACNQLLATTDPDACLLRTDMVHGDFRHSNVLLDHGTVSGVIDIEAIGSGSRVNDYATLLDHTDIEPDALELLINAAVEAAGPDALRACFALVAMDLVRFMYSRSPALDVRPLANRIVALTDRAKTLDRITRTK